MPLSLHDLDESCERGCGELGGHSGTLAQVKVSSPEGIIGGMPTIYVALKDDAVDVGVRLRPRARVDLST
jgi:hypothetical protein